MNLGTAATGTLDVQSLARLIADNAAGCPDRWTIEAAEKELQHEKRDGWSLGQAGERMILAANNYKSLNPDSSKQPVHFWEMFYSKGEWRKYVSESGTTTVSSTANVETTDRNVARVLQTKLSTEKVPTPTCEPLIDCKAAAKIMCVHVKTLKRMASREMVPCVRFGRVWRFRATELNQWIKEQLAQHGHLPRAWHR